VIDLDKLALRLLVRLRVPDGADKLHVYDLLDEIVLEVLTDHVSEVLIEGDTDPERLPVSVIDTLN